MLGMLIVLSLLRLFLPELSDLLMRLKVSVASLNFFEKRSFPNRYLSYSKHCLKDSCFAFSGCRLSASISWKDCSRGFLSGAIIISSSSSRFLEIWEAMDSSKLTLDLDDFLDYAKETTSLLLFFVGDRASPLDYRRSNRDYTASSSLSTLSLSLESYP